MELNIFDKYQKKGMRLLMSLARLPDCLLAFLPECRRIRSIGYSGIPAIGQSGSQADGQSGRRASRQLRSTISFSNVKGTYNNKILKMSRFLSPLAFARWQKPFGLKDQKQARGLAHFEDKQSRQSGRRAIGQRASWQMGRQVGQVTVEFILLLTIMVLLGQAMLNLIKDENWAEKLVQGPWPYLSGMIESGVWDERERAREKHPILYDNQNRWLSVQGEPVD